MLSKKMQDALNKQINAELYSSYLYLSMAAHFDAENLKGSAGWMKGQAQEEHAHAMRIYDYVNDRMGRVTLAAIDAPPTAWDSPLAVFQQTCEHEAKVTAMIHDLVNLAAAEKDHATEAMLQWFVTEQVEEEAAANEIREKLETIEGSPQGLFMLDQVLAQRGSGAE